MNSKIVFSIVMGFTLGLLFMNIPPALDTLMALYGISYTIISILVGALIWSHALMQVPAGIMTDRLGIKRTLFLSILFMGLGNMMPIISMDLKLAVLARVIAGIGTGLSVASTMKLVALYAPNGRVGTYQAFFGGFFSIGSIAAYLALPHCIPFGWQWIYALPLMSCLLLLIMLGMLRLPSESSVDLVSLNLGQVFSLREGWVLGLYHALSFGSIVTLGNWVPSLLAEVSRATPALQFAWGGALVMFVSGIGRLSGGFVLFRIRPLYIVNSSIFILSIIYLCIFWIPISGVLLAMTLIAAWFASINFGALFHLASQVTSSDHYATLFGFINFLANLGAVLFTVMFGFIKDSFDSFMGGFAVLGFLSLLVFVWGRSILRKSLAEAYPCS